MRDSDAELLLHKWCTARNYHMVSSLCCCTQRWCALASQVVVSPFGREMPWPDVVLSLAGTGCSCTRLCRYSIVHFQVVRMLAGRHDICSVVGAWLLRQSAIIRYSGSMTIIWLYTDICNLLSFAFVFGIGHPINNYV